MTDLEYQDADASGGVSELDCQEDLTICKVRITFSTMSSAAPCRSRFTRPVFLWALGGLVTELALQTLVRARGLDQRLQFLMLLPLVPVAFFLVALVRAIQKMDELQKRITLESIAIAFILTLILTFALAGLQSAGINFASLRDDVGSCMLLFWAGAYVFSARRYR